MTQADPNKKIHRSHTDYGNILPRQMGKDSNFRKSTPKAKIRRIMVPEQQHHLSGPQLHPVT